jgi:hypothetical protein
MKRVFTAMVALALLIQTGTAQAAINVDFSVVTTTRDLVSDGPITLSGVTFSYDDFGFGTETAVVDQSGIFGTTGGTLFFGFGTPATALNLAFQLDGVLTPDQTPIEDALLVLFDSLGNPLDEVSVPADFFEYDPLTPSEGYVTGGLNYVGDPFDLATLYFLPEAALFSVDAVSYEAVPEAASFLIWTGVLGLGGLPLLRCVRRQGKAKAVSQ